MALGCINSTDNLVIGRGRIYFDRRINGVYQGERYIGNTPNFTLTTNIEKLAHYSSDSGFKTKDKSVDLERNYSGSLVTDNISFENVALVFAGVNSTSLNGAETEVFENINGGNVVKRNYAYQLGVSSTSPQGKGSVDEATFTIGYADSGTAVEAPLAGAGIETVAGVTLLPAANYEFDAASGLLYIEADAPDLATDDKQIVVKYDRLANSQTVILAGSAVVEGAIRFMSDNPTGENKNYYLPLASVSPDGDYALKGDDWQQIGFNFEALKRDCDTSQVIVYGNSTP